MNFTKKPWEFSGSKGLPRRPSQKKNGFTFAFPDATGHVGYIITTDRIPVFRRGRFRKDDITLAIKITASEDIVFDRPYEADNTGTAPASVRLLLQRNMNTNFGRWWSRDSIILTPGTHVLSVPLNPANWSSVFGNTGNDSPASKKAFKNCLVEPINIGLTFGSGDRYGHGVHAAAGSATFEVLGLKV